MDIDYLDDDCDCDYDLEALMECMDSGVAEVECECGECHRLEPDGETTCDCGRLVQSPLMALGLI